MLSVNPSDPIDNTHKIFVSHSCTRSHEANNKQAGQSNPAPPPAFVLRDYQKKVGVCLGFVPFSFTHRMCFVPEKCVVSSRESMKESAVVYLSAQAVDMVLNGGGNWVVAAPTNSGKTAIFIELSR